MLLLCICVILYFPTAFAFLVEVVFLCALCVQVNFLCMSCRLCLFPNQFWKKTRVICFQKKYPRPILPFHVPRLCMQSFILSHAKKRAMNKQTDRQTQVDFQLFKQSVWKSAWNDSISLCLQKWTTWHDSWSFFAMKFKWNIFGIFLNTMFNYHGKNSRFIGNLVTFYSSHAERKASRRREDRR